MSFAEHINFAIFAFIGLWVLFANLITIQNKFMGTAHKYVVFVFKYFVAFPFIILDVLFNIVYGTIMFLELPNFKTAHYRYLPTFTERLADRLELEWFNEQKSWRWYLSKFICKYMLEPWDYNHCGLASLRKINN